MNRNDLKDLAKIRVTEAKTLLNNWNYDGAYYLSGYVIECGLKACIAKQTKKYDFPNKRTVDESHTHDLTKLVKIAGLELALDTEIRSNVRFARNWAVVKDWSESSRYEKHTAQEAKDIYSAIMNRNNGVLRWVKHNW
jgi:HEPN domain-containing protein